MYSDIKQLEDTFLILLRRIKMYHQQKKFQQQHYIQLLQMQHQHQHQHQRNQHQYQHQQL